MPDDNAPRGPENLDTVLLDIDGTLLDSGFHHTIAWVRAFAHHGETVPAWRVHRAIGMGGDRLVAAVAGDEVEDRLGDALRETHGQEYERLMPETVLLPGAVALLDALRERGLTVVLASSSSPAHAEHPMKLLDADHRTDAATSAEDADDSKPSPDLLEAALERVGGGLACMVGDAVWDVRAASEAGIPTIGLLSGGYSTEELTEAGAVAVFEDTEALLNELGSALDAAARYHDDVGTPRD